MYVYTVYVKLENDPPPQKKNLFIECSIASKHLRTLGTAYK